MPLIKRITAAQPDWFSVKTTLGGLRSLAAKEATSHAAGGLANRLRMWRRGFLGEAAALYQSENGYDAYLSDYARFVRSRRINGSFATALNDKLFFFTLFGQHVPTPEIFAVVRGGRVFPLRASGEPWDLSAFFATARGEGRTLVFKPMTGGGGRNIHILESETGHWRVNQRTIGAGELETFVRAADGYILTEYAAQAGYSSRIYPRTTNSIRVVTMLDPDSGEAFIPVAVHRFGTHASEPVDNWTQGGLSASVDVDTGVLSAGVSYPAKGRLIWRDKHPDSGSRIRGVQVPHWPSVRKGVTDAAERLGFIPYIGWDVVITEDNYTVLEGNTYTDVNLLQVHRPLLADSRVREFYRHHGVIR